MGNTPIETKNKDGGKQEDSTQRHPKKRGFIAKTLRVTGMLLQLGSLKRTITVPFTYAWRPMPRMWAFYRLMFKTEYFKYGENTPLSTVSKSYLRAAGTTFLLAVAEAAMLIWRYEKLSTGTVAIMGTVILFTLSMSVLMFRSYKKVRYAQS